jgi:hypothetical protein
MRCDDVESDDEYSLITCQNEIPEHIEVARRMAYLRQPVDGSELAVPEA